MGYGDALMATGEVLILKKKFPNAKFVIGDGKRSFWSEMFENNPDIVRAGDIKKFDKIIWIYNYEKNRPYRIYNEKIEEKNYIWNKKYKATKGIIYFSSDEIKFAESIYKKILEVSENKKIILIEPNRKNDRKNIKGWENRDWGFAKWQKVVDSLKDQYVFLQTSFGNQPKLKGVINLHNINFRYTCSIMSRVDLFLGTEGGLPHAAAALEKKAVVIFGGWIDPKITGYDFHSNLYIDNDISPCGSKYSCEHCKECMEKISVESVIEEINSVFNKT
tara:strand:+ start:2345 stop:3172 length:828 start_codon:yes stop_codon:yes gene_type:complete